jgi:hypothetical protein
MDYEETIKLSFNSQGVPIFPSAPELALTVTVSENGPERVNEVEISGTSASLKRLAEILLGVSKMKDYHVHLEAGSESPIKLRPKGLSLTIANSDRSEDDRRPATDPPEWARG